MGAAALPLLQNLCFFVGIKSDLIPMFFGVALLLGTITSSLIVLRVEAFWQQAAIGALLLLAIAFDRFVGLRVEAALRRRSARRAG